MLVDAPGEGCIRKAMRADGVVDLPSDSA